MDSAFLVSFLIPEGKGGLKENSMVNLAQLLTIDKGRLTKKVGYLGEERMAEVDEAIAKIKLPD